MGKKEIVEEYLCPLCENTCKDCMQLQSNTKNNVNSYKCLNYVKKDNNVNASYVFKYIVQSDENKEELICKII